MNQRNYLSNERDYKEEKSSNSPLRTKYGVKDPLKPSYLQDKSSERYNINENINVYKEYALNYKPIRTSQERQRLGFDDLSRKNEGQRNLKNSSKKSEENLILNDRHEELRKQIALKEKLLAQIKNERVKGSQQNSKKRLFNADSAQSLHKDQQRIAGIDLPRRINLPLNRNPLIKKELSDQKNSALNQRLTFKTAATSQPRYQVGQVTSSPLRKSNSKERSSQSRGRITYPEKEESQGIYSFRKEDLKKSNSPLRISREREFQNQFQSSFARELPRRLLSAEGGI